MAAGVSLLLVMGLPGAGKSTLCWRLCERIDSMEVRHVEFDEAGGSGEMKTARVAVETEVRTVVCERRAGPGRDLLLLLDDNFFYDSMRQPFLAMAKDFGCGFGCLEVITPLPLCLRNDAGRTTPIGEATIARMAARMEWATERHGEDACLSVADVTTPDWAALLRFIARRHASPLSRAAEEAEERRRAAARRQGEQNALQQADLFLRRLIREHASAGAACRRADLAQVKKAVLASLRADPSSLPDVTAAEGRQELESLLRRRFATRLAS